MHVNRFGHQKTIRAENIMNGVHFITFGDGSLNIRDAANRLSQQALETGWFKTITKLHSEDLVLLSEEWFNCNHKFIINNKRGYGYWIWKPFIIFEHLKKIPRGHILLYADAGFEISNRGYDHFQKYLNLANEYGILGFEIEHLNQKWVKGDLLNYFGLERDTHYLTYKQREAGFVFLRSTCENISFASQWSEIVTARNYKLVDDSPSNFDNPEGFIESRHDQSIFTLLTQINNIGYFPPVDHYHPEDWKMGRFRPQYPFHSLRNKSGNRMIR